MVKIVLQRTLTGLVAVDEPDIEAMRSIPLDSFVTCEIKRARNIQFHRKFFALVRLVWENLPEESHYSNEAQFLVALKVGLGHCETVILKSGETAFIPSSISFSAMDEIEFNEFYNRAVDLIIKHFIPGIDRNQLLDAVLDLIS